MKQLTTIVLSFLISSTALAEPIVGVGAESNSYSCGCVLGASRTTVTDFRQILHLDMVCYVKEVCRQNGCRWDIGVALEVPSGLGSSLPQGSWTKIGTHCVGQDA